MLAAAATGLAGCLGAPGTSTEGPTDDKPTIDAVDGAWTHPRGNPEGTRFDPTGTVPAARPRVAWEADVGGDWGRVAVAEGRVVVAREGAVVALAAATGEELWRRSLPSSAAVAGPVLADHCYVGAGSELWALSPADGTTRWRVETAGDDVRRLVATGGTVYATTRGHGDHGGATYAAADGEWLWQFRTEAVPVWSFGSLAVAGDAVHVVGENAGSVTWHHALDRATGAERWHAGGLNHSTALTVADGTVLAGGFYGTVVAQTAADGAERWRRERPPAIREICTDGDRAYVGSSQDEPGSLAALSLADGATAWTGEGHAVVGAGDGLVAVDDGTLRGYGRASGERRWERAGGPDVRAMALADGVLFPATDDGRVLALTA